MKQILDTLEKFPFSHSNLTKNIQRHYYYVVSLGQHRLGQSGDIHHLISHSISMLLRVFLKINTQDYLFLWVRLDYFQEVNPFQSTLYIYWSHYILERFISCMGATIVQKGSYFVLLTPYFGKVHIPVSHGFLCRTSLSYPSPPCDYNPLMFPLVPLPQYYFCSTSSCSSYFSAHVVLFACLCAVSFNPIQKLFAYKF